jgi:hypothetical protein
MKRPVCLRVNIPCFSCQILMTVEFSRQVSENSQMQNFIKIRRVGAEFFHADRRVDRRTDVHLSVCLSIYLSIYLPETKRHSYLFIH